MRFVGASANGKCGRALGEFLLDAVTKLASRFDICCAGLWAVEVETSSLWLYEFLMHVLSAAVASSSHFV